MKSAGFIIAVLGTLLLIGSTVRVCTQLDLNDTDDIGRLVGPWGVALLLLVFGIKMIRGNPEQD